MDSIVLIIVLATSIWVLVDAKTIGVKKGQIPEGGNVMIQFILKKKGEFDIGYAEAPIKVNPNLPEETRSMIELSLTIKGSSAHRFNFIAG